MSRAGASLGGCASCKGRCCREYTVNVTPADLRRLSTGMSVHPREFVTLREKDDGDFRFRPGGPVYDLRLRHRPDTQGCVFLMEIAPGHARCGAYLHRPAVCATYPAALKRNTVMVRDDTLCGGSDSWNLTAMDLPGLRAGILANRAAWAEHLGLAERWNAYVDAGYRTRTHDELYDFLLDPERSGVPELPGPDARPDGSATPGGDDSRTGDDGSRTGGGAGAGADGGTDTGGGAGAVEPVRA